MITFDFIVNIFHITYDFIVAWQIEISIRSPQHTHTRKVKGLRNDNSRAFVTIQFVRKIARD